MGGLTINYPCAVRSNLNSRLATARASNCSSVTLRAIALGSLRDKGSNEVEGDIIEGFRGFKSMLVFLFNVLSDRFTKGDTEFDLQFLPPDYTLQGQEYL